MHQRGLRKKIPIVLIIGGILLSAAIVVYNTMLRAPHVGEYTLIRFYIPWNDSEETVTSVKYWLTSWNRSIGRIVVGEDGHFYVGGRRVKFIGVNIGGSACFPQHEDAEQIAARLEKLGVNLVRLHGIDANWEAVNIFGGSQAPTTKRLDPTALDRLDYFIAKLKEHGIYVNLNLLVARRFRAADGLPPEVEQMDWKDVHALMFIDPRVRELQKEYIRQLLTHRNPYTNMTYVEDPGVAFVEIANEMGSWFWYMLTNLVGRLPETYRVMLEDRWNSYIAARYGSIERFLKEWKINASRAPALTSEMYWKSPDFVREAWLDFIYQLELETYTDFYSFIKRELGYKGIVIGSTAGFSPLSIQSHFDIIDAHAYWQHPQFPGASWDPQNWYVVNEPMINHPLESTIVTLASYRVVGKPFVVSEYNHPAPNMYAPEGIVMLAAYAALQDWDGIIYFAYGSLNDWDARRLRGFFDVDQDPVKMALMLPAYMLFVRGDVKPAEKLVVGELPPNIEREFLKNYNFGDGLDVGLKPETALMHRVAVATLSPPPPDALRPEEVELEEEVKRGVYKSDNSQVVWDVSEEGRGLLTVTTERSIVLVGYVGGRRFDFGSLSLEVGDTLLGGWGTVALIAYESERLDDWSRLLLIASGYATNEGMVIRDYETKRVVAVGSAKMQDLDWARGKKIYCPFQWGQRGDWGPGPTLVEPLTLTVKLRTAKSIEVWALDSTGRRVSKIPVKLEGEYKAFEIEPSCGTIWYEVVATS